MKKHNKKATIELDDNKKRYSGHCGCCDKNWKSIKEMTEHILNQKNKEETKRSVDFEANLR